MKLYLVKEKCPPYGRRHYVGAPDLHWATNYAINHIQVKVEDLELVKEVKADVPYFNTINHRGLLFWTTDDVGDGDIKITISEA